MWEEKMNEAETLIARLNHLAIAVAGQNYKTLASIGRWTSAPSKNEQQVAVDQLDKPHKVKAKIRLQHKEADATLFPHENNRAKIIFDEPQMSVTPGQSAVFYTDDVVVGGGIIEHSI